MHNSIPWVFRLSFDSVWKFCTKYLLFMTNWPTGVDPLLNSMMLLHSHNSNVSAISFIYILSVLLKEFKSQFKKNEDNNLRLEPYESIVLCSFFCNSSLLNKINKFHAKWKIFLFINSSTFNIHCIILVVLLCYRSFT